MDGALKRWISASPRAPRTRTDTDRPAAPLRAQREEFALFTRLLAVPPRLSGKALTVLVTGLAVLAYTASAAATGPTHMKFSITDADFAPAGELCDFDYYAPFTAEVNTILFGDPDNPTRVIDHVTLIKTHTNVDTGYSLTEVDHFTQEFDAGAARFTSVGNLWHLRDASGKLVVVHSGQDVFDTNTGELLKVTPNDNPDFAAVICPALGGSPAT
jgi:hypothetical protein